MTHHTHEDTRSAAAQLAEAKARRSESWRDPVWKELDGLRDALADEVEDDRRENDEQARAEARWARRGYDQ